MRENELKRLAPAGEAEARSRTAVRAFPDAAAERGLLDVAVASVGSPIGELLVAVTPRGLARVAFEDEDRDHVLEELARVISPRVLESARATERVRRELEEFFGAERTRFDLRVDRRLVRGIARDVLSATRRVPYGRVSTYGEIARRIGRPTAARAVGRALGSNPIPIVIPCHRVVGANGALTGYAGGIDRKAKLLALEGAVAPPRA